jgi:O-antigen ligase
VIRSFLQPRSVNEVINWLVVLLAFSLPLYRAWVSLASVLVLLLWFFQDGLRERAARLRRHRLTIAIGVFLALNLLSLLWSSDPASGFEYWRKYLYLLIVPAVATSLEPRFGERALIAFVAGTVLSALMMPVVIVANIHIRHIHPGNPAVTMSHLDYSMVLAVAALLILIHLGHTSMAHRQRAGWTAALVVIVWALLLNLGRSGQLAFVGTLAVLIPFGLRRHSRLLRTGLFVVFAACLTAAYALVPTFHERVETAVVELHDAVVDHRVDTNQGKRLAGLIVGWEIVRLHPVIGTGIGGNLPEFHRLLDTDFPQFEEAVGWYPHLHNQYLQVATELGLVGLASLLAVFVALFAGRYRSPELQTAAVAVGCAYLLGFVADPFLHKQLPLVLFALSSGVISSDDEAFIDRSSQSTVDS